MKRHALIAITKLAQLLVGLSFALMGIVRLSGESGLYLVVSWELLLLSLVLVSAWLTRHRDVASHALALVSNGLMLALAFWQVLDELRTRGVDAVLLGAFGLLVLGIGLSSRALVLALRTTWKGRR